MTISSPSFPPADDLLSWIETTDWSAIADRLLTVALYIAATCHALAVLAAPHVAAALRTVAARLDRTSAAPVPSLGAMVQRRLAAGESQRSIARSLGISRHAVARWAA
jgi:putative intracellular protease/amidase